MFDRRRGFRGAPIEGRRLAAQAQRHDVRLQQLAADEHAVQLEALVVGPYDPRRAVDGQAVLDGVLALARVCPNLEALFLGDLHPDWGCRDLFHVRVKN